MSDLDYRRFVAAYYPPRHPHLYQLREATLAPALVKAVRARTREALLSVGSEVHPGVFAFEMLQPDFCRELLEEVAWFEDWSRQEGVKVIRPNTMNNYGAILDDFGFAPFLQQLMTEYVSPLASLLFADVGGASLERHHGFVVEYAAGKDVSLDFHVDASEITLNACLGKEFSGGALYFGGVRCGLHQETHALPGEQYEFSHRTGWAVLHRGRHRHAARPNTKGERSNLILWCSSPSFGRRHDPTTCPDWCGWRKRPAAR